MVSPTIVAQKVVNSTPIRPGHFQVYGPVAPDDANRAIDPNVGGVGPLQKTTDAGNGAPFPESVVRRIHPSIRRRVHRIRVLGNAAKLIFNGLHDPLKLRPGMQAT